MVAHLHNLRQYQRARADVGFQCRCGVKKVALIRDVLKAYPDHSDPNWIARRMRCRACGRFDVTAYPVMSDEVLQPKLFKATWGFGAGEKD